MFFWKKSKGKIKGGFREIGKKEYLSNQNNPFQENLIPKRKQLHVTGGKPLSSAYLNNFFNLFSIEQILRFEELYLELKDDLDSLCLSGEMFMQNAREAYIRYQDYKQIDSFEPMNDKALEYVEDSLRRIVKEAAKERRVCQ